MRKCWLLTLALAPHRVAALVVLPLLGVLLSHAPARPASFGIENTERSGTEYWTPERLRDARPMPLPTPTNRSPAAELQQLEPEGGSARAVSVIGSGRGPTVRVRPDRSTRLFTPAEPATVTTEEATDGAPEDGAVTRDASSGNGHYSSQPLVPRSAASSDPYRRVGKLFFRKPGQGDFVCSASVLRPRILLTAGHCVHSGKGANGFFDNFRFVPAFDNGNAPYGSWNWAFVWTTNTWINGGATFPNAADYAIIELQDRTVNGNLRRIGDVVGFLGFRTGGLHPNHVHMLGYPLNLDNGQRMRQTTAASFRTTGSNTVEYGSNMRGGSSGGPWVQNFAGDCTGTNCAANRLPNAVVGVTSYGPVDTAPKYQGASVFDSRFTQLLNTACAHRAGNC